MSDASPEVRRLYARSGEVVTARKWNALIGYIESLLNALSNLVGPELLKDEYGTGFFLRAAPQPAQSFVGAFYVSGGTEGLTVGLGLADGQIPTLQGKLIDGSDADGEIPTLRPDDGPNEEMRSWVCLEAFAEGESKQLREELPLILTHRNQLTAEAGQGILPLAMLQWSDATRISGIYQAVYFNQQVIIGETKGRVTVRFDAAA
jgi:hypothetical protein